MKPEHDDQNHDKAGYGDHSLHEYNPHHSQNDNYEFKKAIVMPKCMKIEKLCKIDKNIDINRRNFREG